MALNNLQWLIYHQANQKSKYGRYSMLEGACDIKVIIEAT